MITITCKICFIILSKWDLEMGLHYPADYMLTLSCFHCIQIFFQGLLKFTSGDKNPEYKLISRCCRCPLNGDCMNHCPNECDARLKVSISSTFYAHLFSYKSFLHSLSLITVWLCDFCRKNIGAKAARKILIKLTKDFSRQTSTHRRSSL